MIEYSYNVFEYLISWGCHGPPPEQVLEYVWPQPVIIQQILDLLWCFQQIFKLQDVPFFAVLDERGEP